MKLIQKLAILSAALLIIFLFATCYLQKSTLEMVSDKDANEEMVVADTVFEGNIPIFPFPPPTPSSSISLPERVFKGCLTLGDANALLSEAIWNCGYEQMSYYRAPNGFVLITQLEQIDKNAVPQPVPYRFNQTKVPNFIHGFSLNEYFNVLFKAKPGYYRCFAFMITDTITTFSGEVPPFEDVILWLEEGGNKLPLYLAQKPINKNYRCMVLLYEFRKDANDTLAIQTKPSKNTCLTHLKNVNLWHQLQQQ